VLIVVSIPVSLHWQAMFVLVFNGLNFSNWNGPISLSCVGSWYGFSC